MEAKPAGGTQRLSESLRTPACRAVQEEMVAAGTPQQDTLRWLQELRETVSERLAPCSGPQH